MSHYDNTDFESGKNMIELNKKVEKEIKMFLRVGKRKRERKIKPLKRKVSLH